MLLSDASRYSELISLFCKTYHLVNCIAFFYVFNYYTLNFPANYFSFEIFLSKLTCVMTFSFLVILLSLWCNTFRNGTFRIEYCLEKTVLSDCYLKGIWNIWNIISIKYKSWENINLLENMSWDLLFKISQRIND